MAKDVATFMLKGSQPEEEGAILVANADQNGIVMRRQADEPPTKAHRTKGDKASQRRMATVATVYSMDRYYRTPQEGRAALFRDAAEPSRDRPAASTSAACGTNTSSTGFNVRPSDYTLTAKW